MVITAPKKKWFYKPQKEVNKVLNTFDLYRLVEQIISKNDVFEKYIVQKGKEVNVLLFQMKKTEYGEGYQIHQFKTN